MTGSFSTLQQLLDYSLRCPICSATRDLEINVGPDTSTSGPILSSFGEDDYDYDTDLISLTNYELTDKQLLMECKIHLGDQRYSILFVIDTLTNELRTTVRSQETIRDAEPIIKATRPSMYFNIWAKCWQCRNSQINTHDINLDILSEAIYPLEVECETRSITVGSSGFQLEYDNLNTIEPQAPKIITVFRLKEKSHSEFYDGPHPDFEISGQPVYFPMTEFDFSDIPALHKRLSTLVFFA